MLTVNKGMEETGQKPEARDLQRKIRCGILLAIVLASNLLLLASSASAAWFDAAWPYRRSLEVKWDVDRATGEDVAWADVFTAGHAQEMGDDIRIATDAGKVVPSKVLFVGPGDSVRVAFAMPKGETKFYAYWGNPKTQDKKPEPFKARAALLLESRTFAGGVIDGFDAIEDAWNKGGPRIGAKYLPGAMLGYNPFGEQQQVVSKLTGAFFAAVDGEYTFASTVDDVGALYVDGKPLVFARIGPGDARHSGKMKLTRGRHDLLFYHVDYGGDTRFTVAWKPPTAKEFTLIDRAELNAAFGASEGPLEQQKKTLVADFVVQPVSESWVADNYAQRYKFKGQSLPGVSGANFEWDFGDGQTASGETVEHVYMTNGVYPVRVTAKIGNNSDTQTTKFAVHRNYDGFRGNPLVPPTDEPKEFAAIVEKYDVTKMPLNWLPHAARLLSAGGKNDAANAVARRMATEKDHGDAAQALGVLHDLPGEAAMKIKLWESVPADSDLQPAASRELAGLLLWSTGDFAKAVEVLTPFEKSNDALDRVRYGQALVLAGKADEGAKVLEAIEVKTDPARRVAMSGAITRTIEAFLEDKDWESGDETWNDWMSRFPNDFLVGYGVWLKVRLIETRGNPTVAAKLAEAFVTAVPTSAYAPRLLDKAARLIEKSDATKSAALRQRLREKYPEDPLSQ